MRLNLLQFSGANAPKLIKQFSEQVNRRNHNIKMTAFFFFFFFIYFFFFFFIKSMEHSTNICGFQSIINTRSHIVRLACLWMCGPFLSLCLGSFLNAPPTTLLFFFYHYNLYFFLFPTWSKL